MVLRTYVSQCCQVEVRQYLVTLKNVHCEMNHFIAIYQNNGAVVWALGHGLILS